MLANSTGAEPCTTQCPPPARFFRSITAVLPELSAGFARLAEWRHPEASGRPAEVDGGHPEEDISEPTWPTTSVMQQALNEIGRTPGREAAAIGHHLVGLGASLEWKRLQQRRGISRIRRFL